MSTVADRAGSSERAGTDERPDASAGGRTDEPAAGDAPGVDSPGSRVEDTSAGQNGQLRKFKRGCWYCHRRGHNLSECPKASELACYGAETPSSLGAIARRERGR